ncbi:MAG: DUF4238 domain-containing protein [Nitrospira sp.]|nr:DUF4238 domain-containing protein [Nitrospira sp.]MCW5781727.1 DUF4238 domain-containing protein [Nitrospirales bacterium]
MAKHKKQHFVPACYLKAWRDPDSPTTQTPYLWLFDKDGSNARRKAPENILHETDMYTIHLADGSRDLVLERGLNQLETEFVKIRNRKLNCRRSLDHLEQMWVCAFTAAAQVRTPSSREHHRQIWEMHLKMITEMMEGAKTSTSEQKGRSPAMQILSSNSKQYMTYEQVKELHDHPMQSILFPWIKVITPLLCKLDLGIFVTKDEIGFITSDHPCVWFDGESYKRPPLYRGPALMYPTIEITLPLSPSQCLFLNRHGISGYLDVNQVVVDEVNRRVRFEAKDYFVVRKSAKRECWFHPGFEPDDSWDKLHAQPEKTGADSPK